MLINSTISNLLNGFMESGCTLSSDCFSYRMYCAILGFFTVLKGQVYYEVQAPTS